MPNSRIAAAAMYVPARVVTNQQLVDDFRFPRSAAWLDERTGIRERRYAEEEETTVSMGAAVVLELLQQALPGERSVDVLIMTSSSCEYAGTGAMMIADASGLRPSLAMDLSAGCSGFAVAFDMANQYVRGGAERVMIVASERTSRHLYFGEDGDHYKFAAILGDGAGAVLIEQTGGVGVESTARGAMPEYCRCVQRSHLRHPDYPHIPQGTILFPNEGGIDQAFLQRPVEVAQSALAAAGLTIHDVDWVVTHQPRMDMLLYTRAGLGASPERHHVNVDRYGNTTTASIPICLTELLGSGKLQRGQRILMLGMGAGFQVVAHVLRF